MIKIGNDISSFSSYSCRPANKKELENIIEERISKEGLKCDLNDIDTSLITDMGGLFIHSTFNGNISKWDTSNVKNMSYMFYNGSFNGDISKWDTSKVEDMSYMFFCSWFNQPIGNWDVRNVRNMGFMFKLAEFNQDISNWKRSKDCNTKGMFIGSVIEKKFKPKSPR